MCLRPRSAPRAGSPCCEGEEEEEKEEGGRGDRGGGGRGGGGVGGVLKDVFKRGKQQQQHGAGEFSVAAARASSSNAKLHCC